jgi:single-stranded-DNA-specific exonuclease
MRFPSPPQDSGPRRVLGVSRSATGRVWHERLDAAGAAKALAIRQRHGLDDALSRILAARGVEIDDAMAYLDPTIRALMPDPDTLTDMAAAVEALAEAIETGAPIGIFGDYDVDGATSAALLHRYLAYLGFDAPIYIPDRQTEGYGPNPNAIRDLALRGIRLLVTVDCGSTSFEALQVAADVGLQTVVIDHHQCGTELPIARAVVNPNRQDDLSGLGYLAAVGVTFMVVVALNRALKRRGLFEGRAEPDLMALIDLVALGTVADVVPLIGLNRALVTKGLVVVRRRSNAGLAALGTVARLSGPPTPYHLGFLIGPRINAGGRIGDAAQGARLLTTDDAFEAERIAAELDTLNKERQALEALMLEEADAQVAASLGPGGEPGNLVLASSDGWHPGIVGLIAARLKERWKRPAFAVSFDRGELGTGSGRSIPGVDLGAAVRSAVEAGIIVKGGGHAMAAGLTVDRERLDALRLFLDERLGGTVEAAAAERILPVDGVMTAGGATTAFVEDVERAGPFGSGSPEPVFVFPAHRIQYADEVGNGHVRLTIASGDGSTLKGMAFRAAREPLGQLLFDARGRNLHIAGSLTLDHWQGEPRVQLRVIDASDPTRTG